MDDAAGVPLALQPTPRQTALTMLSPRRAAGTATVELCPGAERFTVPTRLGRLTAYRIGSGPVVAFAHGWESSSADFKAFVPGLTARGFTAVAMDFAGHGASEGQIAPIPECAGALGALQAEAGPFHALVAHSLGCAHAVEAMAAGLKVARAVLIAAPRCYNDYVQHCAREGGWSEDYLGAVLKELQALGVDAAALDLPRRVRGLPQPGLVMHAEKDHIFPVRFGQELARAWPGSVFAAVPGSGHRRILVNPGAVERTLHFITG